MPIKPFMISSLTEEAYIFIFLSFQKAFDAKHYTEILLGAFKQHAPSVLINYPPQFTPNDQRDVMSVMATRWIFTCSSRYFLEKAMQLNKSSNTSYYHGVFDFALDFPGKIIFQKMSMYYYLSEINFFYPKLKVGTRVKLSAMVMFATVPICRIRSAR